MQHLINIFPNTITLCFIFIIITKYKSQHMSSMKKQKKIKLIRRKEKVGNGKAKIGENESR